MKLPSIANLLRGDRPGFDAALAAAAATAFAAPFGRDVDAFWRACPRADWMLFVAGWSAVAPRAVVAPALRLVREAEAVCGSLDGQGREVSAALDRFASGGDVEGILATYDAQEPMEPVTDIGAHMLRAALRQTCAIAARGGPLLGPSYPKVCSQLALYASRAVGAGTPDEAFLLHASDVVRSTLPAPALPDEVPESWRDATEGGWAQLVRAQAAL